MIFFARKKQHVFSSLILILTGDGKKENLIFHLFLKIPSASATFFAILFSQDLIVFPIHIRRQFMTFSWTNPQIYNGDNNIFPLRDPFIIIVPLKALKAVSGSLRMLTM